ncbi:hypothetical protein GF378_00830 [Candidatus Pacearchaeota archaeon]|nr:hypothetical protein [Candidatus Pacearchaeota archaeon]
MDMINAQETRKRTQGEFNRSLLLDEIVSDYLPFLQKNIHNSEISYSYKLKGKIGGSGYSSPDIKKLTAIVDNKLAQVPIEFNKRVYVGENKDTGEEIWGFKSYSIWTTPGYSINQLSPKEVGLIDRVKELTDEFSSNL